MKTSGFCDNSIREEDFKYINKQPLIASDLNSEQFENLEKYLEHKRNLEGKR